MFGNSYDDFAGAVVFSEDCWPAAFDVNAPGGPSALSSTQNNTYPTQKGFAFRLHPVLYRHSRPFAEDVLDASGVNWLVQGRLDDLIKAVEQSKHLSVQDRRMVYSQLLEVVENAAKPKTEESFAGQYKVARQRLTEKLAALGPAPR